MRKLNGKRLLSIVLGLILTVSMAAFFVSCKGPVQQLPEECTVTFETEGGTAVDPIVVKGGEMAEKPENPTDSGEYAEIITNKPVESGENTQNVFDQIYATAEENADKMISRYKLFGSDPKGLYSLDQEYAGRVYTGPSLVL